MQVRTPMAAMGLALAAVGLIAALAIVLVSQGYRDAIARGEKTAQTAAHAVAAQGQWLVETSRQTLRRIDEALGKELAPLSADGPVDIDEAVSALPDAVDVRVLNATGVQLYSSNPAEGRLDFSDRDYFRELQAGKSWIISPLLTDRASGKKVFAIAHRLDRGGVFVGVAVIFIPASLLSEFWAVLDLGENSSVSLLREDGWLVARHPIPEETLDLSDYVLFTDYLPKSATGVYHADVSPADGHSRIVGYVRMPNAPLVALAAVSTETVLQPFWTRIVRLTLAVIPTLAIIAGLSVWVARLLQGDEERRAELDRSLEQNRTLLREVHHRVKNNLQTVSSLIQLQPLPAQAKKELRARIGAMATVHEQLYRRDNFGEVQLGDYLSSIVEAVRQSYGSNARIEQRVEPLMADPETAVSLGLIVNELATNAMKYAFPNRDGELLIALSRLDEDKAQLVIADDGVGLGDTTSAKGIGLRLVQSLVQKLHGESQVTSAGGLCFEMTFPLHR